MLSNKGTVSFYGGLMSMHKYNYSIIHELIKCYRHTPITSILVLVELHYINFVVLKF